MVSWEVGTGFFVSREDIVSCNIIWEERPNTKAQNGYRENMDEQLVELLLEFAQHLPKVDALRLVW